MNFKIFKEMMTPVPEREPEVFLRLVRAEGVNSVKLIATDEGGKPLVQGNILSITESGMVFLYPNVNRHLGLTSLSSTGEVALTGQEG